MGLFRRRPQPAARPCLNALDTGVMNQLRLQGTDLSQPRHALHYSYFPTADAAQQAAEAADAQGWFTTVGEPLPDSTEWRMRAERPDIVLSDDVVRDSTDFFEAIADRYGGEYSGWEAAAD